MPDVNISSKSEKDPNTSLPSWKMNFIDSACTGGIVGCIFHPWDRALHLSMLNVRPFFLKTNFTHPLQGISLVMIFKPITNGSYLFFQSELHKNLKPVLLENKQSESTANILIGLTSGLLEGIIKTPCNALKVYSWNHPGTSTFRNTTDMITRPRGMRSLFAGSVNTMQRDGTFGSVYEFTRFKFRKQIDTKSYSPCQVMGWNFLSDSLAAGIATICSSPWNLTRILNQSKNSQDKPISSMKVMERVYRNTMAQTTFKAKRNYLFRSLGFGPGTLRIMVEMPVKQLLLICLPVYLKKIESAFHAVSQNVRISRP